MDSVTDILAATGLVLSVLLAYLQIQKGQRASLLLQEEHLRNELKLKLYEKASSIFLDANRKISTASTQYYAILSSLQMRAKKGLTVAPTTTSMPLADTVFAATRGLTSVILILEEYEIIFSRFRTFRRQLSEAHSRLLEVHDSLWSKVILFLPVADPGTGKLVGPVTFPTHEELAAIEELHQQFVNVCNDISGYMIDLQIESQNELLGSLFGRTLPPRHPADPTVPVLSRDSDDAAERPPGSLI